MKKSLVALSAAALLLFAGTAYAAEAHGKIKSIDAANKTVTLQDNTVYELPANVDAAKLKVGEEITVFFEPKDHKNIAHSLSKG